MKLVKSKNDLQAIFDKIGLDVQIDNDNEYDFTLSIDRWGGYDYGRQETRKANTVCLEIDLSAESGHKLSISDPNDKQFVLKLEEKAHTIARTVSREYTPMKLKQLEEKARAEIYLPAGSVFRKVGKGMSSVREYGYYPNHQRVTTYHYNVEFDVPAQVTYYLIGTDEEYPFISILPRACNTVSSAHEALRPKGVPKNALRQGEFFFVKPTQAEIDALDFIKFRVDSEGYDYQLRRHSMDDRTGEITLLDDQYSGHRIKGVIYRMHDADYVLGEIVHERHETLELKTLYKVVPNAEIPSNDDGDFD